MKIEDVKFTAELRAEWVKLMTDGQHTQCRSHLRDPNGSQCCLDVLREAACNIHSGLDTQAQTSVIYLRTNVRIDEWFILDEYVQKHFGGLNDSDQLSFLEIAEQAKKLPVQE